MVNKRTLYLPQGITSNLGHSSSSLSHLEGGFSSTLPTLQVGILLPVAIAVGVPIEKAIICLSPRHQVAL